MALRKRNLVYEAQAEVRELKTFLERKLQEWKAYLTANRATINSEWDQAIDFTTEISCLQKPYDSILQRHATIRTHGGHPESETVPPISVGQLVYSSIAPPRGPETAAGMLGRAVDAVVDDIASLENSTANAEDCRTEKLQRLIRAANRVARCIEDEIEIKCQIIDHMWERAIGTIEEEVWARRAQTEDEIMAACKRRVQLLSKFAQAFGVHHRYLDFDTPTMLNNVRDISLQFINSIRTLEADMNHLKAMMAQAGFRKTRQCVLMECFKVSWRSRQGNASIVNQNAIPEECEQFSSRPRHQRKITAYFEVVEDVSESKNDDKYVKDGDEEGNGGVPMEDSIDIADEESDTGQADDDHEYSDLETEGSGDKEEPGQRLITEYY